MPKITLKKLKAILRRNQNIRKLLIAQNRSDPKAPFSQENNQKESLSLPKQFLKTVYKSKKIRKLLSQRARNLNHLRVTRRILIKSLVKKKM